MQSSVSIDHLALFYAGVLDMHMWTCSAGAEHSKNKLM